MESIDLCSLSNKRRGGITLIVFADFPYETTFEKQKALFAIGRKCALESPGDELRQVAFVTEAWLSCDQSYAFPSEDPNRKEAITLWTLDIDGRSVAYHGYIAEIIRQGEIIDLLEYKKQEIQENRILYAFLAGFCSGKLTDRQLGELIEKHVR